MSCLVVYNFKIVVCSNSDIMVDPQIVVCDDSDIMVYHRLLCDDSDIVVYHRLLCVTTVTLLSTPDCCV